ncbi:hypothetical protein ILYODFUR_016331, partial [Ilyodon furcidens]
KKPQHCAIGVTEVFVAEQNSVFRMMRKLAHKVGLCITQGSFHSKMQTKEQKKVLLVTTGLVLSHAEQTAKCLASAEEDSRGVFAKNSSYRYLCMLEDQKYNQSSFLLNKYKDLQKIRCSSQCRHTC